MELTNVRMHKNELEFLKLFFSNIIYSFEDGACFFVTDTDKVTFKLENKFHIPGLEIGSGFSASGPASQAMQARKVISLRIPRDIYGIRLFAVAGPIWDDNDTDVIGAWVLPTPRQHKLVQAFDSFAPVLTDLLPEGGFIYVADKEKYVKKQASAKFDIANLQEGVPVRPGSVPDEAVKQKKQVMEEVDAAIYGVPVLAAAAPLFDEETGEVVGSFGLAIPRKLAYELKQVVTSLDQGLAGVAASMQQITTAANDVSANQNQLNADIKEAEELLGKINEVMNFIKEIADQTNMLGLNAAIEAARAGETGRGFSVVAEEIRKLAEQSKTTVVKIRDLTGNIQKSIGATSQASKSTLTVMQHTAAATEEANASLEEMASLAQKLAQTAADL